MLFDDEKMEGVGALFIPFQAGQQVNRSMLYRQDIANTGRSEIKMRQCLAYPRGGHCGVRCQQTAQQAVSADVDTSCPKFIPGLAGLL